MVGVTVGVGVWVGVGVALGKLQPPLIKVTLIGQTEVGTEQEHKFMVLPFSKNCWLK